jgi:hypothetical protein
MAEDVTDYRQPLVSETHQPWLDFVGIAADSRPDEARMHSLQHQTCDWTAYDMYDELNIPDIDTWPRSWLSGGDDMLGRTSWQSLGIYVTNGTTCPVGFDPTSAGALFHSPISNTDPIATLSRQMFPFGMGRVPKFSHEKLRGQPSAYVPSLLKCASSLGKSDLQVGHALFRFPSTHFVM